MGQEEKGEEEYPLRWLHNFLYELDKEWDSFRMGSLIGIVTSGALFVFLISRLIILSIRIRTLGLRQIEIISDVLFLVLVAALIFYAIYYLFKQFKFFKRWERRIGLLLHLEEELLGEKESTETKN